MTGPVVRKATAADEPGILELADELAAFPVPPWRTAREIQRADDGVIRAALDGDVGIVAYVVDGPRGLDGAVCISSKTDYFTGELVPHVEVLAVSPAARGQGIARALMDAAESWARDQGARRISLNVWAQNERARGLYEHLGYVPETMHYLKELRGG